MSKGSDKDGTRYVEVPLEMVPDGKECILNVSSSA